MKSIILVLVLFFGQSFVNGQSKSNFSIGFRNHTGGLGVLNQVIKQYNDSRPWLDNTLNRQVMQNGFEFGFEKSTKKYGVAALRYFRIWNNSMAKGKTPSGEEFTRRLKTRVAGLELVDFWYHPLKVGKFQVGGGLMPMGMAVFRVRTKFNDEKWKRLALSDLEYASPNSSLFKTFHPFTNFHLDAVAEFHKKEFHFQLFYSANWFNDEYNLIYLNLEINPNTGGNLLSRQKHNQNQFGLKISMNL